MQKNKAQKHEMPPKKGNTMTLMDRKKTFGKRVIRNNVEVVNKLPDYGTLGDEYAGGGGGGQYQEMNPYQKMNGGYH